MKNSLQQAELVIFYSGLPSEVFPKIKKYVVGMLTVFARTDVCEERFSLLNLKKRFFYVNRSKFISVSKDIYNKLGAKYISLRWYYSAKIKRSRIFGSSLLKVRNSALLANLSSETVVK